MSFYIQQNVSDTFPQQICSKNLAVDSGPILSRRFRKRQE